MAAVDVAGMNCFGELIFLEGLVEFYFRFSGVWMAFTSVNKIKGSAIKIFVAPIAELRRVVDTNLSSSASENRPLALSDVEGLRHLSAATLIAVAHKLLNTLQTLANMSEWTTFFRSQFVCHGPELYTKNELPEEGGPNGDDCHSDW